MSKEKPKLDVAEQLEKFRQATFKIAAIFFVAVVALFYVIPTMFWVIIPLGYMGLTDYIITAIMAIVFLIAMYRVNIPVALIDTATREYMKDKQEFVALSADQEEALAKVEAEAKTT